MEYSMYKTYAAKYSASKKKIIAKYKKNGVFAIPYTNKGDMSSNVSSTTKALSERNCPIGIWMTNCQTRLP